MPHLPVCRVTPQIVRIVADRSGAHRLCELSSERLERELSAYRDDSSHSAFHSPSRRQKRGCVGSEDAGDAPLVRDAVQVVSVTWLGMAGLVGRGSAARITSAFGSHAST